MWQVVGHKSALDLIERSMRLGRVAHAYLFSGPPQVGKMTLARDIARALNCQGADAPCQACQSCRRITSGLHADVQVIGLLSDEKGRDSRLRKEIGIDQVRALQHDAQLRPYESRHRIFIVDGAEHLSDPAANALLKTLEEPPQHVVLLLLATDGKLLPATVVSRCQQVALRPLSTAEVSRALADRWQAGPERSQLLARLSGGRLGWAVNALGDETVLSERQERLQNLGNMLRAGRGERFAFASSLANQFTRDRSAVHGVLDLWVGWWRDLLLVKCGCSNLIANMDQAEELSSQAGRLSLEQTKRFLEALQDADQHLEGNVNPRLALDALMLRLPFLTGTKG